MNPDMNKYLDTLAKLKAKSGMPSGGAQYTAEVALGPRASAKNQAMMRVAKPKPVAPVSLKNFIKAQG